MNDLWMCLLRNRRLVIPPFSTLVWIFLLQETSNCLHHVLLSDNCTKIYKKDPKIYNTILQVGVAMTFHLVLSVTSASIIPPFPRRLPSTRYLEWLQGGTSAPSEALTVKSGQWWTCWCPSHDASGHTLRSVLCQDGKDYFTIESKKLEKWK